MKLNKLNDIDYNTLQADVTCIGGSTELSYSSAVKYIYGDVLPASKSESLLRGDLIHKMLLEELCIDSFEESQKKMISESELAKGLLPLREKISLRMLKSAVANNELSEKIAGAVAVEEGHAWVVDGLPKPLKVRCKFDFVTEEDGVIFVNDLKSKNINNGFGAGGFFDDKYLHQMKFYSFFAGLLYPEKQIKSRIITLKIINSFSFEIEEVEYDEIYTTENMQEILEDFCRKIIDVEENNIFFSNTTDREISNLF